MSSVNECILCGVVTWGVHLQVTFFGGGSFFFVIHLGDIIMIFCCTSARVFLKWNSSYSSLILLLLSIYLAYLSRKCGEECSSILIISFLCILIFWLFSSSYKPYLNITWIMIWTFLFPGSLTSLPPKGEREWDQYCYLERNIKNWINSKSDWFSCKLKISWIW